MSPLYYFSDTKTIVSLPNHDYLDWATFEENILNSSFLLGLRQELLPKSLSMYNSLRKTNI